PGDGATQLRIATMVQSTDPHPSLQPTPDTRKRVSHKRPKKGDKPEKPYDDFPLFPHATKRWAKKILGKLHYFGPWDDPQGALAKYQEQKDDLHAGRRPRPDSQGLKVAELCDAFLVSKKYLVDTGELVQRTWNDYKQVTDKLVTFFIPSRLVS